MHENKNDNTKKILQVRILKSAKNHKLKNQTLYLNLGSIWTNLKSSEEIMNHSNVTANPQNKER